MDVTPLQNGSNITRIQTVFYVEQTSLRTDKAYVKGYSLIFSSLVMVVMPVVILSFAFYKLFSATPQGNVRNRTARIIGVIILMFILCHLPKVREKIKSICAGNAWNFVIISRLCSTPLNFLDRMMLAALSKNGLTGLSN